PLMEDLGLDEATATVVVERCAEEAKIVAVEQEEKKKRDAVAKASATAALGSAAALADAGTRGIDGVAFANPLLPQPESAAVRTDELADATADTSSSMPGALETTPGSASE